VKIFLDADPDVRAARRLRELEEKGTAPPAAEVAREIRERDHRDSTRADSPLVPATDAIRLDSTALSLDQVEQAILEVIVSRRLMADG
jgi:cytidylate kinase